MEVEMSNNMKAAIEKNSTAQVPFMFEDVIFRSVENHIFEKEIKAVKQKERLYTYAFYAIALFLVGSVAYNFYSKHPFEKQVIFQIICGLVFVSTIWGGLKKEVGQWIERV
jgi:uncharacterized membrane protein YhfC